MCGFLIYTEKGINKETIEKSFQTIKYHSPDSSKVLIDEGIFGFHKLSIMGINKKGMQPFENEVNLLVYNGETYDFQKMKSNLKKLGHKFNSESDCEILLPMYKEYGLGMFNLIGSEFSIVLYDKSKKQRNSLLLQKFLLHI